MKKLICLLLALTILFAAALAESGLKERRPALEEIPLDDALAATEAPVESAAAEEDVENIRRALDELLSGLDGAAGAEEDAAQPSTLDIVLAEINGLSVLGYGVYNVYAGESVVDYIVFNAEGDAEVAAALAAPQSLRFTIWAYDINTSETFFTADVTL